VVAVSRLLILKLNIANKRCEVKFNFGVFLGYYCNKSKLFNYVKKNYNGQNQCNTVNTMMQCAKREVGRNIKACDFLHYRAGSRTVKG